ncbi:hypothetical protein P167DRAFT_38058 [Morchella conica CCBAS932]|uniref:Uncharacterized protein n=1 Tax=Morchella conica CCBAS932 TaxID=1392247 RepID=A0A3N4L9J9_9PEZI|nr:hypothetical protein P167DRAFT_38058 [Morchella conica CCBAS932]
MRFLSNRLELSQSIWAMMGGGTQDVKVIAFILFYFSIIALSRALFFFSHAGTSCGPGSEKVISRCVNHAGNVGTT